MILSNKQKSKALIRLCGRPGLSAPLLFANTEDRFTRGEAHLETAILMHCMPHQLHENTALNSCHVHC